MTDQYETFLKRLDSFTDDDARNEYLDGLWKRFSTTEEYQALFHFLQNERTRYMQSLISAETSEAARTHAAGSVHALETTILFIVAAPFNLLEQIPPATPTQPDDAEALADEELVAQDQPWDRMEDLYAKRRPE